MLLLINLHPRQKVLLNKLSNFRNRIPLFAFGKGFQIKIDRMRKIKISETSPHHKIIKLFILKITLNNHIGNKLWNIIL